MKIRMTFFVALSMFSTVSLADSKTSLSMIYSHSYNIGNSIGAIANNFNIKETFFVDAKSICRHLGIVKGAVDAINSTIYWDKNLKQIAAFSNLEGSLAVLTVRISETTSFCGRNYAAEGSYDSKLENNMKFIKENSTRA